MDQKLLQTVSYDAANNVLSVNVAACPARVIGYKTDGSTMQADAAALAGKETERAEAAAQLERRMAAMEAVLAARRSPVAEAKPEAARGPGADLRFQVRS